MKSSIKKLKKYFELEEERGFDNKAIMGGIDRILDNWEAEALAENLSDEIIQMIDQRLRDYQHLSENSRSEMLDGIWTRLQKEFPDLPPLRKMIIPADVKAPPASRPQKITNITEKPAIESTSPTVSTRIDKQPAPADEKREPLSTLNAPLTAIHGIGPKNAQTMKRLHLYNLEDMLFHFPRRYIDYSHLKPIKRLSYGDVVTIIGTIDQISSRKTKDRKTQYTEVILNDGTAAIRITWFNRWNANKLQRDQQISVSGKVEQYLGRLVMNNPDWEPIDQQQLHTNRIVPVYPLTQNISQNWLRKMIYQVVSYWSPKIQDHLPESIISSASLIDLGTALLQIHYPDSWDSLKAAQQRLAFDEIFLLQLGVMRQKQTWQSRTAEIFSSSEEDVASFSERLPYALTASQKNAIEDIRSDLNSGTPMNRLLQGDVGSGKTVVAAFAIATVTQLGAQAAIMAPTGILADQHYKNLKNFLSLNENEIRLLVGSTSESEKEEIKTGLSQGSIKLVVGTHALIESLVEFNNLQLAIIDEQHRFGVEQRAILRAKGNNPHIMVMTATPIPRTLAFTIYGDLDLTLIDEMPPGRQEIDTFILSPRERERAYRLINSQIEQGNQAFIIYPLVEESENSDSKSAVEEYNRLKENVFPHCQVGLLHGRMKPDEKDDIMTSFRSGKYSILVSTSVIEVGVDIPKATVMLVEGADRFGLAQLHQFRGRVGRGEDKAYCLLIPDKSDAVENERLQVMAETNDGFILAERDLEQRGPGEFLGARQSGYTDLRLANLTDIQLIEKARRSAQTLIKEDPNLQNPENHLLSNTLRHAWREAKGDIS
ncbi:MAG: ATP-dependent DNA helicase RecG [Anaerolineales bacterium]|nr:ATP-dependent DNA helicase RecG [Anaerolineales bacterium]